MKSIWQPDNWTDGQKVVFAKATVIFFLLMIGVWVYTCSNPCEDFCEYDYKTGNYERLELNRWYDSTRVVLTDSLLVEQIANTLSSSSPIYNSDRRGYHLYTLKVYFKNSYHEHYTFMNDSLGIGLFFQGNCTDFKNDSLVLALNEIIEEKSRTNK